MSEIPTQQSLAALLEALDQVPSISPLEHSTPLGNAVFVGSGDSLASGLIAHNFGHRSMSSGDITWTGQLPARADTIVGISHSGTSGATVKALRKAREQGLRTIAITSNPDSPIAEAADAVQIVPTLHVTEAVPSAGHIMLGLGVAAVCGADVSNGQREVAKVLSELEAAIPSVAARFGGTAPAGISVLTLPDLRSAGDFWTLKLIEATGVVARVVPLEESGHVDYFIGPQNQLTIQLLGGVGRARHERLQTALSANGQNVVPVDFMSLAPSSGAVSSISLDIAVASFGAFAAHQAALTWGRPPFRGGAVNMDASHIKLSE
ncbi:SIS domain-containing protein [Arthrobacter sp. 35W]|uniref:SIS domain-containing protein n=1 Tax=Arthrobacter sp. 35W TaxID=1132441 RepID=UPI0012DD3454|nr:SIS domain-containing protein [Arthrobacter sp. 35W]